MFEQAFEKIDDSNIELQPEAVSRLEAIYELKVAVLEDLKNLFCTKPLLVFSRAAP